MSAKKSYQKNLESKKLPSDRIFDITRTVAKPVAVLQNLRASCAGAERKVRIHSPPARSRVRTCAPQLPAFTSAIARDEGESEAEAEES